MCKFKVEKQTSGVDFSNPEIYTCIFLKYLLSSSVCYKKIFINKYGVTDLALKIDATDGKKWVKFVALQQNSATLIYDLNTMKGTVES